MEDSNRSANPDIHAVFRARRRSVLRGGLAASTTRLLAPLAGGLTAAGCVSAGVSDDGRAGGGAPNGVSGPVLGFRPVQASGEDRVSVPEGYVATVFLPWGDPVGIPGNMPVWRPDASNTAAEQAAQLGMHHDGMHYFPLDDSRRGLLAINHEYTDEGLLHPDGVEPWTEAKTRKSMASHGVSVVEVMQRDGGWQAVRPSRYARRITASTPMTLSGPAAGHPMMRTAADPSGRRVLGTFANCAHGFTPWGTYLTCEENWAGYFKGPDAPDAHQLRWGLRKGSGWQRWHLHEPRFDARLHPNESNRFGWVVEIDPTDPTMTPIKRTALGRAAREGATVTQTRDGRVAVYMGEDARFEYLYKFVSRDAVRSGGFAANRELLDHGTLYVARFDADGTGRWLPLVHGLNGLTAANGFADPGEVLIKSRQAADLLGATKMDRPEWVAVDPVNGAVYCSLTNNSQRGRAGKPGPDAANPRANNTMGAVIRWKERDDFDAVAFDWDHFVLAGDPANARPEARGNVAGDPFGCPDGLVFDARGVLWIMTDASSSATHRGEFARLGNNAMLAADPRTGEIRRFLVGPHNCEITGATFTPDLRTLFVNIQHPGEPPSDRSDPGDPSKHSRWPHGGRPRSATVVVRRSDGGVIGR